MGHEDVAAVRAASRELVRRWGYLGRRIAGTELSGSAVHAIIELGRAPELTVSALALRLGLEKSTVSRLVTGLVSRGLLVEQEVAGDGRAKALALTSDGAALLARVDHLADAQVIAALERLGPSDASIARTGLEAYARALPPLPGIAPGTAPGVEIRAGYEPGLMGRLLEMIVTRMVPEYPFGPGFEARVAADMGEFLPRLANVPNGTWHAHLGGRIVGGVTIDGEDLDGNVAHLRWFVVADGLRGAGIGGRLLEKALDHCDRKGFRETHLWTVKGLEAARVLYERTGFRLAEEWQGDQWGGAAVTEQMYVRPMKP